MRLAMGLGCLLLMIAGCPPLTTTGSSSSSGSSSSGDLDASVPDAAGPPDAARADVPLPDVGPPCGTVPVSGVCEGDLLRYCEDGVLHESDCSSRNRRCELQTDLGGYWCVGGVGQDCEVIDTDACELGLVCEAQVCVGRLGDGGVLDGGGGSGSSSSLMAPSSVMSASSVMSPSSEMAPSSAMAPSSSTP